MWAAVLVPGCARCLRKEGANLFKPGGGLGCSSQMKTKGHVFSWMTNQRFSCPHEGSKVKVTQSCPTLCDPMDLPARFLCPWNYLSQNTGVGSCSLLQGIFPTQGSSPVLPRTAVWFFTDWATREIVLVLLYFSRYHTVRLEMFYFLHFLCTTFCEKYYKLITVQCYIANCVSWVARLTLWTYEQRGLTKALSECLYVGDLLNFLFSTLLE